MSKANARIRKLEIEVGDLNRLIRHQAQVIEMLENSSGVNQFLSTLSRAQQAEVEIKRLNGLLEMLEA